MISTVREYLRDAVLAVCDTAFTAVSDAVPHAEGGVLLVRMDGIGDFFLWLPSARALREAYAGAHVTLLAEAAFSSYAAGLDLFDEVIPIHRHRLARDFSYRYDVFRRIRSRRYDVVILPCYNRVGRFRDGEALVRVARGASKVGSSGGEVGSWRDRLSRRWYTNVLPACDGDLHEFERNDEFMRGLGIAMQREDAIVAARPGAASPSRPKDSYFVIVPGAGSPLRRWPAVRFARLAELVARRTGWTGVLCGGPSDVGMAAEIQRLSSVVLRNCVDRLSLAESVQLICDARIVVGNETGAMHIAATTSTAAVSITGGGHFGRFVPYPAGMSGPSAASVPMPCFHCEWQCIFPIRDGAPAPCIANITVETVWSEVEALLRKSGERDDLRVINGHPSGAPDHDD